MKLLDRLLKKDPKDENFEDSDSFVNPSEIMENDDETTEIEIDNTVEESSEEEAPLNEVLEEISTEPAELAENFLLGLLSHLGVNVDVEIDESEAGVMNINLNCENDNYGILIGRRGETLDAIQRITNTVVNRDAETHLHIRLDAGNYHAKREETVKQIAKKTAARVMKMKRNVTMEPMNAFERHVVHEALQNFNGVSTYSTGTEPNRCVVVSYGSGRGVHHGGARKA